MWGSTRYELIGGVKVELSARNHLKRLGLKAGDRVTVIIKATKVLIGT